MLVKLYGYSAVRSGNFNGRDWSNRVLYVEHLDNIPNGTIGSCFEALKVPTSIDVSKLFVGSDYNVYFNRYGRVDAIEIAD